MDANKVFMQKWQEPLQRLPEDTILEIFSKLPLTSHLAFTCVSKSWCIRFNENPRFIHMMKNSYSLMLIDGKSLCSLDNNSLTSSLLDGIKGHVKKIHCPLVPLGWDIEETNFVGSCNGLFCMYRGKKRIFLWNPCTNEIKFLSKLGFERRKTMCVMHKGHGFGYDSKNDDYKYVSTFHFRKDPELHIYSFRTNTWKRMYVPYTLVNAEEDRWAPNGVLCNGALLWFARKITSTCFYYKVILAFDVTEESVREIPQPEDLDTMKFANKYVDVLDGSLCVLYSNSAGFEVWVMKEYGKKESCTKVFSISDPTILDVGSFVYLKRIECLKTGEILLEVYWNIWFVCHRANKGSRKSS